MPMPAALCGAACSKGLYMQSVIFVLCAVAGYVLAQPIIAAMRARAAARSAHVHARALRALRGAKGRTYC